MRPFCPHRLAYTSFAGILTHSHGSRIAIFTPHCMLVPRDQPLPMNDILGHHCSSCRSWHLFEGFFFAKIVLRCHNYRSFFVHRLPDPGIWPLTCKFELTSSCKMMVFSSSGRLVHSINILMKSRMSGRLNGKNNHNLQKPDCEKKFHPYPKAELKMTV